MKSIKKVFICTLAAITMAAPISVFAKEGASIEPRPANLVTVQAFEISQNNIRCTISNNGIDFLDNVTAYVDYVGYNGVHTRTGIIDYGTVGFFPMHNDFYIGTYTYAQGNWTITDGGKIYYMSDVVGE